jgi:uncharacterized protein YdhG (YjbR/CyaY superfamily)
MAERKAAAKGTRKPAKSTAGKAQTGLTAEERAALRETIAERKAAAGKVEEESALLAKIAQMPAHDRAMAKRIHAIVKASAPTLAPKTWYGMPAYANRDGKVVCFFQAAAKFKSKYATFGFIHDNANLDEGNMWPNAFSLKELTAAEEAKIGALVKKAVS